MTWSRRRRTAVLVAAIGALLAGLPAPSPVAARPGARLATPIEALLVGDSVMNGMAQGYGAPGRALLAARHSFILDSAGCRRLITTSCRIPPNPAPTDGLTVVRARAGQYDHVLVIGAGYDDPTSGPDGVGAAVDTMIAEAHRQGISTVVWLTYREAGTAGNLNRFRAHNAVLRQKQAANPDLVLADWNRISQTLPSGSFSADGIHLGGAATTLMARLIADTLDHLPPRVATPGRCAPAVWVGSDPPAALDPSSPAFTASPAGGVHLVEPAVRLADTRGLPGRLGAGKMMVVPVAGTNGVAADAVAALVTITAVQPCAAAYLTAFGCDQATPTTSVLNADIGTTVANAALIRLGSGALCIVASQPTDVLVDLAGWIGTGGATATPVAPVRLVDTRGAQPVRAGTELAVAVGTAAGAAAVAATVNLAAVQPAANGFLTVLPGPCSTASPAPAPSTSSVNVEAGHDAAASATVGIVAGQICVYSSVDTDVIVDLQAVHTDAGAGSGSVVAIAPTRLADTRMAQRLRAGAVVSVPIDTAPGVPAMVSGAVVNVTAVAPAANGYVVAYGCGATVPAVSTLNTAPGATIANRAVVQLGAARAICLTSSIDTDVVVDVEAWLV